MISEQMYKMAQDVITLYKAQECKLSTIKMLPDLEKGMVLEYMDLKGIWSEYTKNLQENSHFYPEKIRVHLIQKENN